MEYVPSGSLGGGRRTRNLVGTCQHGKAAGTDAVHMPANFIRQRRRDRDEGERQGKNGNQGNSSNRICHEVVTVLNSTVRCYLMGTGKGSESNGDSRSGNDLALLRGSARPGWPRRRSRPAHRRTPEVVGPGRPCVAPGRVPRSLRPAKQHWRVGERVRNRGRVAHVELASLDV